MIRLFFLISFLSSCASSTVIVDIPNDYEGNVLVVISGGYPNNDLINIDSNGVGYAHPDVVFTKEGTYRNINIIKSGSNINHLCSNIIDGVEHGSPKEASSYFLFFKLWGANVEDKEISFDDLDSHILYLEDNNYVDW